ncbi:LacI family DNA-binding transcriptional regulator [Nonomuraea sediminis]|uniref:LacI family DNA-binding transcriptional regulator n=1 Tax=Nonomuraea sediminis TaxID=2835864 RepID=UPI001BDC799D|nr:LacI family DNA-binding transcriptional regulator [Nonomuraea sediminis]
MVTRRDVARLAGTSEAVVSYVLNNGPRNVAPHTRERVLRAIDELGYRPNAVARSLRTSRTHTIGLVVPDNANPFFAELAREIEDVAFKHGLTLLLGNAMDDDEREAAYVRTLIDRQVDGLILIPAHGPRTWRAVLAASGLPCIVLDRELDEVPASHLLIDNESGAHQATTHLLAHGRRRIGCVAGPKDIHPTVDRVAGWARALTEVGLDPGDMPLAHGPFGRRQGYLSGRDLLSRENRPHALFVTSDEQAIGVMRAAAELGLAVPGDVAICSFDGIAASSFTVPALTTMRQPFEQLGRQAVELLLRQITDQSAGERVILPAQLVRRGSCGCPDPVGGIDGEGLPDAP